MGEYEGQPPVDPEEVADEPVEGEGEKYDGGPIPRVDESPEQDVNE